MKKTLVLFGIMALSSIGFASNIEDSLNRLEQQLNQLERLEQQKFNEQAALANAAQERLNRYRAMEATIDSRIADIEANLDTTIFNREFRSKVSEYKSLKAEVQKEIVKEEKTISDFELLKSLR